MRLRRRREPVDSTAGDRVRVAELFTTIQGEGLLTGVPSTFVRLSGCNLRCAWCDTPYASWAPEGEQMDVAAVFDRVAGLGLEHVVLTGGEPMMFKELVQLCAELRRCGRHVTVETAGTLDLPIECDMLSISPKGESSVPDGPAGDRHRGAMWRPDMAAKLVGRQREAGRDWQVKFVVQQPGGLPGRCLPLVRCPGRATIAP